MAKTTFQERLVKSAKLRVEEEFGEYAKPSQIRAILRDPRFYITKRGALKRKVEDETRPVIPEQDELF